MEDLFQNSKDKVEREALPLAKRTTSSEDKRSKFVVSEEDCGIDEVHSVLEMAENLLSKVDIILKKLEAMEQNSTTMETMSKTWTLTTKVSGNSRGNNKKCNEVYRRAPQGIGIPEQRGRKPKETGERLRLSQTTGSLNES